MGEYISDAGAGTAAVSSVGSKKNQEAAQLRDPRKAASLLRCLLKPSVISISATKNVFIHRQRSSLFIKSMSPHHHNAQILYVLACRRRDRRLVLN